MAKINLSSWIKEHKSNGYTVLSNGLVSAYNPDPDDSNFFNTFRRFTDDEEIIIDFRGIHSLIPEIIVNLLRVLKNGNQTLFILDKTNINQIAIAIKASEFKERAYWLGWYEGQTFIIAPSHHKHKGLLPYLADGRAKTARDIAKEKIEREQLSITVSRLAANLSTYLHNLHSTKVLLREPEGKGYKYKLPFWDNNYQLLDNWEMSTGFPP